MQRWLTSRQYHRSARYTPLRDYEMYSMTQRNRLPLPPAMCLMLAVLFIGIIIIGINILQINSIAGHSLSPQKDLFEPSRHISPIVWIHGSNMEAGYLDHVVDIFKMIGYEFGSSDSSWDLLWSHEYPFPSLTNQLRNLQPNQKINHFPGTGYITNKASLASLQTRFILPAFHMPDEREKLLKYMKSHPEKMFVQKDEKHRGIQMHKITNVSNKLDDYFVQEFLHRPFLINGRKFDLGIYTILTSINPLRVYIYDGDILLRFCSEEYYPFDTSNLNKYVIGDHYTPAWEIADLQQYIKKGYSVKETFFVFLKSLGKNPNHLWQQIHESIREVYLMKENDLIESAVKFPKRHFFELMRFDFMVDEDLNVFILEANMSPNLSSSHFPPNRALYEQVLYSLFSLVGLATVLQTSYDDGMIQNKRSILAPIKDLLVSAEICEQPPCTSSCLKPQCDLCPSCLTREREEILKESCREHLARWNCRRIFPPPMSQEQASQLPGESLSHLNPNNSWMVRWFQGKCLQDVTWCQ